MNLRETEKLAEYLQNKAEQLMKQVVARREAAACLTGASLSDLKAAKRIAEQMSGRKHPPISMKKNARDAGIQNSIATKLEAESLCLNGWAEMIRGLAVAGKGA